MADYTRVLKQHLREAGCQFERQGKGDHEIWYSPITNIPQRFSMFMTGESGGALKPYLLIEDSTGKEYSFPLITGTHANKGQTET